MDTGLLFVVCIGGAAGAGTAAGAEAAGAEANAEAGAGALRGVAALLGADAFLGAAAAAAGGICATVLTIFAVPRKIHSSGTVSGLMSPHSEPLSCARLDNL